MSVYQVRLGPSGPQPQSSSAKIIAARSPFEALSIVQRTAGSNPSELWDGEQRLARMRNVGDRDAPIWRIE